MFTEERHMAFCFYPYRPPLSRMSWKFFASHLVSTTCKLTHLPFLTLTSIIVQLGTALNSLYQKQPSRGGFLVFRKYAVNLQENTCAEVQFIELALWHGCSPVNLLHIFRTPFPKNTSRWRCFCWIPSLRNKSFILCESKLNLIHNC